MILAENEPCDPSKRWSEKYSIILHQYSLNKGGSLHRLCYFCLAPSAFRHTGAELVLQRLCLVSHSIKQRKPAIHFISVYVNVKN